MASLIPSANASGTGSMTLAGPSTNSNQTVNIPDSSGSMMVSGNMPAFSAYASSSQSISSATPTKVTLGTEIFDTNNNFASSTFTPTVAGYYQINGLVRGTGTTHTAIYAAIYKNGSAYRRGVQIGTSFVGGCQVSVTDIVYCNGTTDYLELYGLVTATSGATFEFNDATSTSVFSGCLVRTA
jgi:hypothetical protein